MKFRYLIKKKLISVGKSVLKIFKKVKFFFKNRNKRLKPNKKVKIRKKGYRTKRNLLSFLFLLLVILVIFLLTEFYQKILKDLPNVNEIYSPPQLSTKILDRNGSLLYKFYTGENRTWVPIEKIPQSLIWATIAIEDKDFFNHRGISTKGILKALIYNFKKDKEQKLRGGSTITQQLVKNVFLSNEKSVSRKVRELILTILVESKLSKKEILEKYFNQVSYGGEIYGAQEAAWKYFNKNVWDISMAEAAFLAGLPAAPSSYSPFGNSPELANFRQRHVISEMVNAKFITKEKAEEILREKIEIKKEDKKPEALNFIFYVKNFLEEKYGFTNIEKQGLTITTSLDQKIQSEAIKINSEEIKKIKALGISNGAVLVINIKTGDILAMVGGVEGQYNVTTALRQPGSSIKPINYLLALQNGMTLDSIVEDTPVSYPIKGQKPYTPQNYNGKYLGKVTLKTALGSSLNIPSVKLLNQNGVENMIALGKKMGINTWEDKNRFGLSLALGSGEVRMTELAQAYSIFANLGEKIEINPILKIDNYLGEKIFEKKIDKKEVIDPKHAFLINSVLSDDSARAPIFGLNSKLKIKDKTVAVKTGTTNSLRDNWCIGWTPDYLVATWVGNNDNSPMSWVASGVTGATPIWNKIMSGLIQDKPDNPWATPSGITRAKKCGKEEYFIEGTEDKVKCFTYKPTPTTSQ